MIPRLADEMLLVSKLRSLRVECPAFDGLTTVEQRRAIVQKAIDGIEDVTYTGHQDGKRISLREQFTKVYGA